MADTLIAAALFIAFAALLIFVCYKGYKKQKAVKDTQDSRAQRFGSSIHSTLKHTDGLPLAAGVPVEVYYSPDKFTFVKDLQEITVSREKITDVDCVTGKDLKAQQLAGAVAGKYILGGLGGAIIGSLSSTSMYLVISYTSDGEDKYIILDTYVSGTFALKVQKEFKNTNTSATKQIEL